jgi:lipopolysaccharide biosynthesis glycosyltransferase
VNVVFVSDRSYVQHLAVALASLLDNNSGMNIYVINSDLSGADWKKLEMLFDGKDSKLIDAKIEEGRIASLISNSYFTKTTYYKLFITDIVKGDKALYLDPDIVVCTGIDKLYNADLSNTFLAAVDNRDIFNHRDLDMDCSAKYFNAGVMLINLEYWRAFNVKEKVIEFVGRKPEAIRFDDQDGLNAVINGNWLELHPKYNVHAGLVYADDISDSKIQEAVDSPVIVHFTGSSKPWHFRNHHPYKHFYWKYLRMTPYKYFIPDDLNLINILKYIVPGPIKKFLKNTWSNGRSPRT